MMPHKVPLTVSFAWFGGSGVLKAFGLAGSLKGGVQKAEVPEAPCGTSLVNLPGWDSMSARPRESTVGAKHRQQPTKQNSKKQQ